MIDSRGPGENLRKDPDPDANLLITIEELSKILKVSTRTISRLKSEGRLPQPITIGRLVRWRRSDIETWLADRSPR